MHFRDFTCVHVQCLFLSLLAKFMLQWCLNLVPLSSNIIFSHHHHTHWSSSSSFITLIDNHHNSSSSSILYKVCAVSKYHTETRYFWFIVSSTGLKKQRIEPETLGSTGGARPLHLSLRLTDLHSRCKKY